ncbi:MAG: hypothetical protein ABT00_22300 [Bordetella sp. SCN 68-11]|nr:MAG: hypothetical protein ABT00_22300 [Bordetella sp. SCN 68-11]
MAQNSSVNFFDAQFRRQIETSDRVLNPFEQMALPYLHGTVLDYGCGMGNLALAAARLGCQVRAFDASQAAIDQLRRIAKAESLPVEAAEADLRSHVIHGEFDAVVCIGLLMFFDCLTAAAVKGELTYLSVVLGAAKREDGKIGSFTESIKLLDYAEKNFSVQLVVQSSDPIAEVPVKLSSERDAVVAVPEGSISALLPNDFDRTKLVIDYDVVKSIDAPVTKGQALGNATFSYEGKEYGKLALVAAEDIGRSQVLYVVSRITGFFGSTAFKIIVGVLLAVIVLSGAALVTMRVTNQRRRRRRGGRGKYRR